MKNSVLDNFPLCPPCPPPPEKRKFYFYCRLAFSEYQGLRVPRLGVTRRIKSHCVHCKRKNHPNVLGRRHPSPDEKNPLQLQAANLLSHAQSACFQGSKCLVLANVLKILRSLGIERKTQKSSLISKEKVNKGFLGSAIGIAIANRKKNRWFRCAKLMYEPHPSGPTGDIQLASQTPKLKSFQPVAAIWCLSLSKGSVRSSVSSFSHPHMQSWHCMSNVYGVWCDVMGVHAPFLVFKV